MRQRFSLSLRALMVAALVLFAHAMTASAALVSYWPANGNATDVAGGRNGTIVGAVPFSSDVPLLIGSGTSFDLTAGGNGVTYDVMGADSLAAPYSLSMWVKSSTATGGPGTFFGTRGPSDTSFDVKFQSNTQIHGDIGSGSGWIDTSSDANFDYEARWHHIVYTVTNAGYTVYADGKQVNTEAFAGTPLLFNSTHDIAIGAVNTGLGENFNGHVDDVAIFNNVLTPSQVRTLSFGFATPLDILTTNTVAVPLNVFGTGLNASGLAIAPGGGNTDPHWTITSVPGGGAFGPALVEANNGAWLTNTPAGVTGSTWIATIDSGNNNIAPGAYRYQTTFDIGTGLSLDSAVLELALAADDSAIVLLNGQPTGISVSGFANFSGPFLITDGFVYGVNTLEVVLTNGGTGDNPGGLRVEIRGATTIVPEPATGLLALVGLPLLLHRRRAARA